MDQIYIFSKKSKKKYKKEWLFVNYFKPSMYTMKFEDIDLILLQKYGIKLIICDLDNTLIPFFQKLPQLKHKKFIQNINNLNLKFIICSNNVYKRVKLFSKKLNINDFYANCRKPFANKLANKIMKKYNVKPNEVIVIGDQLITDILWANQNEFYSILVKPIVNNDIVILNKIFHFFEKNIYGNFAKRKVLKSSYFISNDYYDFFIK